MKFLGSFQYSKICERIGRLKEKHSKVAHHYTVEAIADENKEFASEITWEHHPKESGKSAGIYCIRTNQTHMDIAKST